MEMICNIGGREYCVDIDHPHDLCLPVAFGRQQVAVFGGPPATSHPLRIGNFVGSVAEGGSCNCAVHTFSPHTGGTHTECIGHITRDAVSIFETMRHSLVPATLITVTPVPADHSGETYAAPFAAGDSVITSQSLAARVANAEHNFLGALIIRTLPNGEDKRLRDYDAQAPAFFTTEAMRLIVSRGVEHLLVDLPSLDRLDDGGLLGNHRIFWAMAPGDANAYEPICARTVTELIYASDSIADGSYVLNLQVAPLLADAAPSWPLLYAVRAR